MHVRTKDSISAYMLSNMVNLLYHVFYGVSQPSIPHIIGTIYMRGVPHYNSIRNHLIFLSALKLAVWTRRNLVKLYFELEIGCSKRFTLMLHSVLGQIMLQQTLVVLPVVN